MKKIYIFIFSLLYFSNLYGQDIINTLGTNGSFLVKSDQVTLFRLKDPYVGTPDFNIIVGKSFNNTSSGNLNLVFGHQNLGDNFTGSYNYVFGSTNLRYNLTGSNNIAIGHSNLGALISNGNIAIGLQNHFTGDDNIAIGSSRSHSGNNNILIGKNIGSNTYFGDNNILIGYQSIPSSPTVSNQITLGNNEITQLRCNVTTITSLSDSRDKKNIKDLELGINFIMKLKPRQFNWDRREWYENGISDNSKIADSFTAGFIAQELDEAQQDFNSEWLNLVLKDNPEKFEATPGNLLPIIVKAIQDLKAENDYLKSQLNSLSKTDEKILNLEKQVEFLLQELNTKGNIINTNN